MPSDVHDVVTHANFCQGLSKGFSVARGRILAFSIDLRSRLYNTRTNVRDSSPDSACTVTVTANENVIKFSNS